MLSTTFFLGPIQLQFCVNAACPRSLGKVRRCASPRRKTLKLTRDKIQFIDMPIRRNPERRCTKKTSSSVVVPDSRPTDPNSKRSANNTGQKDVPEEVYKKPCPTSQQKGRTKDISRRKHPPVTNKPFPYFELPRELCDHVYSYPTTRHTQPSRSVLDATSILKGWRRRIVKQTKKARLNQRRVLEGKRPVQTRLSASAPPLLHLNVLQTSRQFSREANDILYGYNWFAISLNKLPTTVIETPIGWNLSCITRLQLEL
jgi:hypothetical protein